MTAGDVNEILRLSVDERLRLLELIWESLSAEPANVPLADAHRAVVEARLAEHERDPNDVVSLAEVLGMARKS